MIAVVVLGIGGFVLWRRFKNLERMFDHLWEHGADVGKYAADVKRDLNTHCALALQRWEDSGRDQTMCEDYLDGLHFAIVEIGGFVRHPHGLSMEER